MCIRGGIIPAIGIALFNKNISPYENIVIHAVGKMSVKDKASMILSMNVSAAECIVFA